MIGFILFAVVITLRGLKNGQIDSQTSSLVLNSLYWRKIVHDFHDFFWIKSFKNCGKIVGEAFDFKVADNFLSSKMGAKLF